MTIQDLQPHEEDKIQALAKLLQECFPQAYDEEESQKEVRESFGEGRISRVAVDEDGSVLGWVGGNEQYSGHVWELHPLAVRSDKRGRGIGAALVKDLETLVRERDASTLWLGTDDETDQTTLSGVDLYPDVWEHVSKIRNLRGHPYEFYQKQGFVIVGVLPDANGPGKPDIYMAKSLKAPHSP